LAQGSAAQVAGVVCRQEQRVVLGDEGAVSIGKPLGHQAPGQLPQSGEALGERARPGMGLQPGVGQQRPPSGRTGLRPTTT
jgi:hypothetical protein